MKFIIFLLLSLLLIVTLYRLTSTVVQGVVTRVYNCHPDACDTGVQYFIQDVKMEKIIKTPLMRLNDTMLVYINPTDMNSPKYCSPVAFVILYVLLILSLMYLVVQALCIVRS
jgi:hypothetical protein